ncbi:pickpocket protein 28 [Bombyx mori]
MESDKEIVAAHSDSSRKEKRQRQKSLILEMFFEFTSNTTLHGFRYMTQRGSHPVEKIFWIITFTASVLMCAYAINNVWIKWQTSPVIVTLSERLVSVDEVPFPSITICPQKKNVPSIYNYYEVQTKVSREEVTPDDQIELEKFQDVSLVCNVEHFHHKDFVYFNRFYSNVTLVNRLLEVAPDLKDFTSMCRWHNKELSCKSLFHRVLTSQGVCYTMNTLAASEIFRTENIHQDFEYLMATKKSQGYVKDVGYNSLDVDTYPRRGRKNGVEPDLIVILKENLMNRDKLCNVLKDGFKLYLYHPADLPQSLLHHYIALPGQTSSISLRFEIQSTSTKLNKPVFLEQRQCFFPHERQLRYFQSYSPNNCRLECLTNYTFKKCGCVGFYMPFHISNRICTMEKHDCMDAAIEELATARVSDSSLTEIKACNCLPSCNMVDYNAGMMMSTFHLEKYWKNYIQTYGINNTISEKLMKNNSYSKIEVY